MAGPESTVKVGFLVAGDRATYVDAAGIAVDEINDGGGLLGRTVELVARSGIEEPSVSVEAAEQMILDDEVIALIGPNRSSHAVVVGETAQRHGRPMITTAATNPDVTKAGDFVFMAAFTDLFQGGVMARFAREELGLDGVAVLTMRGEVYTEGISEIFVSRFRGSGGTVVAEEFFDRGETDFSEPLGRLAAAGPGALFISGLVPEIALVTQQARSLPLLDPAGLPVLFLGADSWDHPDLLAHPAAELEGSYLQHPLLAPWGRAGSPGLRRRLPVPVRRRPHRRGRRELRRRPAAVAGRGAGRPPRPGGDPGAAGRHRGTTPGPRGSPGTTTTATPPRALVIMTIRDGEKLFHRQIDPDLLGGHR